MKKSIEDIVKIILYDYFIILLLIFLTVSIYSVIFMDNVEYSILSVLFFSFTFSFFSIIPIIIKNYLLIERKGSPYFCFGMYYLFLIVPLLILLLTSYLSLNDTTDSFELLSRVMSYNFYFKSLLFLTMASVFKQLGEYFLLRGERL